MDVKAFVTIIAIVFVSLGVTAWLGIRSQVGDTSAPPVESYDDDSAAPPLDDDENRPKAVAEETEHDFGAMELGETGRHKFVLKNDGEDMLVITKGASTCKCTVSELPSNEIPPGESVEVLLEWEPKSHSKNFAQQAKIWTNDPDQRSIDYRVKGVVTDQLTIIPSGDVDAGNIQEDIGANTRVRMYSNLVESFSEPSIEYEGDALSFEVKPLTQEEQKELETHNGYAIFITISPNAPVGRNREIFSIKTTLNEKEIERDMAVKYSRTGPIRVMPLPGTSYLSSIGLVNFQKFEAAEGKVQEVTLLINDPEDGSDVVVTLAENELPEMTVEVKPKEELQLKGKQAFRIIFTIPAGAPPLSRTRNAAPKVILHTTHPEVGEVIMHTEVHSN